MPRPRVEFVQTQWLDWEASRFDVRAGAVAKVLSEDDDTGAATAVIAYPPGWLGTPHERLTCDEEFLLLEGRLQVNGVDYDYLSYGRFPAGYLRETMSAPAGAVVLTFFDRAPQATTDYNRQRPFDPRKLVTKRDAQVEPWRRLHKPDMAPGAKRFDLKEDPDTGEATWLLAGPPVRKGRFPERHPVVEETFIVEGWSMSPLGPMGPGAYFWRSPDIWHGPFCTPQSGKIGLVRSVGGPLSTEYDRSSVVPVDWHPRYQPILPDAMAQAAARFIGPASEADVPHVASGGQWAAAARPVPAGGAQ